MLFCKESNLKPADIVYIIVYLSSMTVRFIVMISYRKVPKCILKVPKILFNIEGLFIRQCILLWPYTIHTGITGSGTEVIYYYVVLIIHLNPIWVIPVSIICGCRAAGRYRKQ
jgi:hypothetical protein